MKKQQNKNRPYRTAILLFFMMTLNACSNEWLEIKPEKALVVPSKIEHFQALLENDYFIFNVDQRGMGEMGSDFFYVSYDTWASIGGYQANCYIWNEEIYDTRPGNEWADSYEKIYYTNAVLEGIESIDPAESNLPAYNGVKGSALFFRAYALYDLAQQFCVPYTASSAASDMGLPIRLSTDLYKPSVRASVQETYEQILSDLKAAIPLLPVDRKYKTRPSQTAALALLARVYLNMENYNEALIYSQKALDQQNGLMDYNTTPSGIRSPFREYNVEVLFHSRVVYYAMIDARSSSRAFIKEELYDSYDNNDLRKEMYFDTLDNGNVQFVGDYRGDAYPSIGYFGGLATDEVYLMQAECYARTGQTQAALASLNHLLATRWKTGTFVPYTAATAEEALSLILEERKKSLVFRGLRWSDLRRLNKDPRFAITITREFENGDTYTLPPNDPRYVWPIPDEEIAASGIAQNPR